jgi:hypothetical protein
VCAKRPFLIYIFMCGEANMPKIEPIVPDNIPSIDSRLTTKDFVEVANATIEAFGKAWEKSTELMYEKG